MFLKKKIPDGGFILAKLKSVIMKFENYDKKPKTIILIYFLYNSNKQNREIYEKMRCLLISHNPTNKQ